MPVGRPTKLTPAIANAIVRAFRAGGGWREGAQAAGVSLATVYAWRARGRAGEPPYASLATRVSRELRARARRRYELTADQLVTGSLALFQYAMRGRIPTHRELDEEIAASLGVSGKNAS